MKCREQGPLSRSLMVAVVEAVLPLSPLDYGIRIRCGFSSQVQWML